MTQTSHSEFLHLLRSLAASFLIGGVLMGGTGAAHSVLGQLTGRGSTVMVETIAPDGTITMLRSAALRSAASDQARDLGADMEIALGMLLLLTGVTLHAFWIQCHTKHARKHSR